MRRTKSRSGARKAAGEIPPATASPIPICMPHTWRATTCCRRVRGSTAITGSLGITASTASAFPMASGFPPLASRLPESPISRSRTGWSVLRPAGNAPPTATSGRAFTPAPTATRRKRSGTLRKAAQTGYAVAVRNRRPLPICNIATWRAIPPPSAEARFPWAPSRFGWKISKTALAVFRPVQSPGHEVGEEKCVPCHIPRGPRGGRLRRTHLPASPHGLRQRLCRSAESRDHRPTQRYLSATRYQGAGPGGGGDDQVARWGGHLRLLRAAVSEVGNRAEGERPRRADPARRRGPQVLHQHRLRPGGNFTRRQGRRFWP